MNAKINSTLPQKTETVFCVSHYPQEFFPMSVCGARSKGLRADMDLSSPVLRIQKISWFSHMKPHKSFCKTIMQGTIECRCKQRLQCKSWSDNIRSDITRPELLRATTHRLSWRSLSVSFVLRSTRED